MHGSDPLLPSIASSAVQDTPMKTGLVIEPELRAAGPWWALLGKACALIARREARKGGSTNHEGFTDRHKPCSKSGSQSVDDGRARAAWRRKKGRRKISCMSMES